MNISMKQAFKKQLHAYPSTKSLYFFDKSVNPLQLAEIATSIYEGLSAAFVVTSLPTEGTIPYLKRK